MLLVCPAAGSLQGPCAGACEGARHGRGQRRTHQEDVSAGTALGGGATAATAPRNTVAKFALQTLEGLRVLLWHTVVSE